MRFIFKNVYLTEFIPGSIPWHTGGLPLHVPSCWHCLVVIPTMLKPGKQVYVAVEPMLSPAMLTSPFIGGVMFSHWRTVK